MVANNTFLYLTADYKVTYISTDISKYICFFINNACIFPILNVSSKNFDVFIWMCLGNVMV